MRLDLGRCVCPRGFSSTGPGGGDGTLGAATLSILPLPACKSLILKGSGRVLLTHNQPGKPGRTLCRVRDCLANHLLRGWVGITAPWAAIISFLEDRKSTRLNSSQ